MRRSYYSQTFVVSFDNKGSSSVSRLHRFDTPVVAFQYHRPFMVGPNFHRWESNVKCCYQNQRQNHLCNKFTIVNNVLH